MVIDRNEWRRNYARRGAQSHYGGVDRRREERRLNRKSPIHLWYIRHKQALQLYIFVFIACILIAAFFNFKDSVSNSLNSTYQSESNEYEDGIASMKAEENRKLLERNQTR